jgi:hypothetical protein
VGVGWCAPLLARTRHRSRGADDREHRSGRPHPHPFERALEGLREPQGLAGVPDPGDRPRDPSRSIHVPSVRRRTRRLGARPPAPHRATGPSAPGRTSCCSGGRGW